MSIVYGFIGAGNMGSALARAAARKLPGSAILISNRTWEKAEALAQELGASAAETVEIARKADVIFLGVKPQMLAALFEEIRPVLAARATPYLLVSMAAGVPIDRVRELAGGPARVIRIMPNTPCSIGEGVILFASGSDVPKEAEAHFLETMAGAGRFVPLPESLFDAGTAISGCGPAYADLFLEALADGGVLCGLPRATALTLAAETLAGAAKLMLATGRHPGELKDAVCSPAGSTIEGVLALERRAFRAAVTDAVIAARDRTMALKG